MRTLTITIPDLPPKQLSPNWQFPDGGFWIKLQKKHEWQEMVYICAVDARNLWERQNNQRWLPLEKATIKFLVYTRTSRRMDSDNFLAQNKATIDTLCTKGKLELRAEIIVDDSPDRLTILPPEWRGVMDVMEEKMEIEVNEWTKENRV